MNHEPERSAATYLAGGMSRRRRRAFQAHMVGCEDCWAEVQAARRGRALAESGRELAPQHLRERIRAALDTAPQASPPWRPRIAVAAGLVGVLLVALVVPLVLVGGDQPREIEAILADFQEGEGHGAPVTPQLPMRLGDQTLREARAKRIGSMDVTVHTYRDPAGHEVFVYLADDKFPRAEGARREMLSEAWTAELGDAVIYCVEWPRPLLVVGEHAEEVAMVARALDGAR